MYILKNIWEIYKEQSFLKKVIICLINLLIIVAVLFLLINKTSKEKITGEEWFDRQSSYMEDVTEIADHLDTTVTLYYNGNLQQDAYLEQMNMVKEEMILFLAEYEQTKQEVEIKLGTHKLGSKIGCDSAEKSYYYINSMIDTCMMPEYYSDKDKLIYMYLAKSNELRNILYDYTVAVSALKNEYNTSNTATTSDAD